MKSQQTNPEEPKNDQNDEASIPSRLLRLFYRVRGFDARQFFWDLLDLWEERRKFRIIAFCSALLLIAAVAAWLWVYPWWSKRTAMSVARQWMDAGRLDRAAEAVQHALELAPDRPDAWRLAGELARRQGRFPASVFFMHQAALVGKDSIEYPLEWASAALQANLLAEADRALATLAPSVREASPHAHRIAGELARRRDRLEQAKDHFEAALRIDGPQAVDEVPLGIILLRSTDKALRDRGVAYLEKWAPDKGWGDSAFRALLGDALLRRDTSQMFRYANGLRTHPKCTLADIPNCLIALSMTDAKLLRSILPELEKQHSVNGPSASLMIGWLNQIGYYSDALSYAQSLPAEMRSKPPVVVALAESLRLSNNWAALGTLTFEANWGANLDFIRMTYGMVAARNLGPKARAGDLWNSLHLHAKTNGVHAFFAAGNLYAWGVKEEALILVKIAAGDPNVSLQAQGMLARHYQQQRDALGQYSAFQRLYTLRPKDPDIINNYAFFAALVNRDSLIVQRLARENHEHDYQNLLYRCTYAFVLCRNGASADALQLLKPVSGSWRDSPPVAFAYGLALAGAGQKDEARQVLATVDSKGVTLMEAELISAVLGGESPRTR